MERGFAAWVESEGMNEGQVVAHFVGAVAAAVGIAQTEFAGEVRAPALEAIVVQEDAGMTGTGADRHDGFAGTNVYGGQVVTHFVRRIADDVGVAIAELTIVVETPALDGSVVQQCACMRVRAADGDGSFAGAEIHGWEIVAHFARLVSAVVAIGEAKAQVSPCPPALDGVVIENCTGVGHANSQSDGSFPGTQIHGGQVVAHFARSVATCSGIADAALASAVVAPAFDASVIENCAGVRICRCELEDRFSGSEVDSRQVIAHFARFVAALQRVAVPEGSYAEEGSAPAFDRSVIETSARIIDARGNLGGRFARSEIDGGQEITHFSRIIAAAYEIAEAEVAGWIASPAFEAVVVENCAGIAAGGQLHGRFARAQIDTGQEAPHFIGAITTIVGVAEPELSDVILAPAFRMAIAGQGAGQAVECIDRDERSGEGARGAVTHVSFVAGAGSRSGGIGACRIGIAAAIVCRAFVDVGAGNAIARVSGVAHTRSRAGSIGARRIDVAPAIVGGAFIDVRAVVAVAHIAHVAHASTHRARGIGTAIGARCARWDDADAGSIAGTGIAFAVGVGVGLDEPADAVVTAAFLDHGAGITCSAAMVAAANAVDAIRGQTLRFRRARYAIVEPADAAAGASTAETFVIGVGIVLDGSTGAVRALTFLCCRAGNACASAGGVATVAVDAIHRSALRVRIAGRSDGQVHRGGTSARTIAIGIDAFIVGIGAGADGSAGAAGALAFFGGAAGITGSGADGVATDAIDAEAGSALRGERACGAVGLW